MCSILNTRVGSIEIRGKSGVVVCDKIDPCHPERSEGPLACLLHPQLSEEFRPHLKPSTGDPPSWN